MDNTRIPDEAPPLEQGPHFVESGHESEEAWEQVDVGRYMPRRVRGSYRGRALG